jgi:hypothetical protein
MKSLRVLGPVSHKLDQINESGLDNNLHYDFRLVLAMNPVIMWRILLKKRHLLEAAKKESERSADNEPL